MAQARVSARINVMLLVFCVLIHYKIASATTYTVGDAAGWTFGIQSWPTGKQFHAGDILGKVLYNSILKLTNIL